ncbi:MAG: hypothetical protein ACHQ53_08725 [Polyangiales bacterium]
MSGSPSPIHEIADRLRDLTEALRQVGGGQVAAMLERHGRDFTVQTRVRRSVNAIREHLERYRLEPSEWPESPAVMLAANRLEDVCRDALAAGVIVAAPLSLKAQARRKLRIVSATVALGAAVLLLPFLVVRAGVDVSDMGVERRIGPLLLPRGEESSVQVSALVAALVPAATKGVEISAKGGCSTPLPRDAACAETAPRLWPEGRLKTYELKLKNQAYGLLFAITDTKVDAAIGEGRLLLAATDETPEGRYELPLRATYLGYTPQRCELLDRMQGSCPKPRVGEGERHAGLALPTAIIDVIPGDPNKRLGEKRRAQAEAEEARRKAEERAQQIEAALSQIQSVLADTEKMVARRKFEGARERVEKLGKLFEPLESEGLSPAEIEAEGVPAQVSAVRARFDALHDKVEAFENKVFEQTFAVVTAESNRRTPEESLLRRIAQQNQISIDYVRDVYTARADEIQRRIDARTQARLENVKREQEALEKRCGPLPKGAWRTVEHYAQQVYAEPHVEIVLGECLTPRLTERDCWEMRCDYQRKVEVSVERPKVVTQHSVTFFLTNDQVSRHRDES